MAAPIIIYYVREEATFLQKNARNSIIYCIFAPKETIKMEERTQQIDYQNARAEVFCFDNGTEVKEYHVMIHASSALVTFEAQLEAVMTAYTELLEQLPGKPQAVFKRYFLSDAANQADHIIVSDMTDCAKSIIEQAPLDGTKVALWAYLMTNVVTSLTGNGLYAVSHGQFRHLWNGSAHNMAANSEYQTRLLFNEYNMQLLEEGCTLEANCIRTWLFVNDIDLNYGGVVRARNQFFFTQGLTVHTHFIASTGIGGRQQDPNVLSQMDNYAIAGLQPEQRHFLYAPTHLNRTSDYGVSFERGTYIDYADRRHVFISGTASINNKGPCSTRPGAATTTWQKWWSTCAMLLTIRPSASSMRSVSATSPSSSSSPPSAVPAGSSRWNAWPSRRSRCRICPRSKK